MLFHCALNLKSYFLSIISDSDFFSFSDFSNGISAMVTCLRSINEEDAALRGIEVPNAWRRLRKVCEQLHALQVHMVAQSYKLK